MTKKVTNDYLANRAFYQVQAGALVDNPDQRIASDVRCGPERHAGFGTWPLCCFMGRSDQNDAARASTGGPQTKSSGKGPLFIHQHLVVLPAPGIHALL